MIFLISFVDINAFAETKVEQKKSIFMSAQAVLKISDQVYFDSDIRQLIGHLNNKSCLAKINFEIRQYFSLPDFIYEKSMVDDNIIRRLLKKNEDGYYPLSSIIELLKMIHFVGAINNSQGIEQLKEQEKKYLKDASCSKDIGLRKTGLNFLKIKQVFDSRLSNPLKQNTKNKNNITKLSSIKALIKSINQKINFEVFL